MANNKLKINIDADSIKTKVECILDGAEVIESLIVQTADSIQMKC
ncbi:hypothetical protein P4283_05810 [Bacillus thuringiensis]|nr:hypothetical protein [Bacillus thuringiensis]